MRVKLTALGAALAMLACVSAALAAAPVTPPSKGTVKCTNFDTPENCAKREQAEQRSRALGERKRSNSMSDLGGATTEGAVKRNPDGSVEVERVVVEAHPEDFERPALSAQQKLENAWGEKLIPNGPIAYRTNSGVRVECDGAALRNHKRLGLLRYLVPIPPCTSSGDPRPGYLKPSY